MPMPPAIASTRSVVRSVRDRPTIATKRDRAFLVEVVLHASKQILVGDQTTTIVLKNGQRSAGFLRDQTAKQTESATSLMPEGLQAALSFAEFADRVG